MDEKKQKAKPKRFLIEDMFDKYLTNMDIDHRKILPFQLKHMRKAFYGAIGMFLILQRDEVAAEGISEDDAVRILDDFMAQCEQFFADEMLSQN